MTKNKNKKRVSGISTKARVKRAATRTIFHLIVIGFGFLMLYPLLWLVSSSFKEHANVFVDAHRLIPQPFTWENYSRGWAGFARISFATFFRNSFYLAIFVTVASAISSSWVAYGFARLRFRGRNIWFALMIISMMIPGQVTMIPNFLIHHRIGWLGTFGPLTWPAFTSSAFFVFLTMQFMKGIPRELDESAMIDGCSVPGIYFRIVFPLTIPAFVTTLLFGFMGAWGDFMGPLIYLNVPRMFPVALALRNFAEPAGFTDWTAIFAMSTLSLIPLMIIFLLFQRYLVEGISTTGLKG